jgi:predicted outer membrane protein
VHPRLTRRVVANAVAVVAVLGILFGATGCGTPAEPQAPAPAAPEQGGPAAGPDVTGADTANGPLGAAGQGAAALAALGGLGQAQGAAQNVRELGGRTATDGQELLEQLRTSTGEVFAAQPTDDQQAALADLRARSGEQFDQAWLRAADQIQQQVRDAAEAVLADGNASEEAKAAARDALTRLDALSEGVRQAAAPAGAQTPAAVEAGSGGQAAGDVAPLAALLVGLGSVSLAGALWWRRRAA